VSAVKRGTKLLREKLAGRGGKAVFVARFNDGYDGSQLDAPMVSKWVSGERLPSREHMARIEDVEGIPMRDWVEDIRNEPSVATLRRAAN